MSKDKTQEKGEGHRQRLRDKFLESGLSGFHDYEVIELLLTLATPRKDCKEAAKAALNKFKTFQGVLEASPGELSEIKGIGPVNLFGIKLVNEAVNRYLEKKLINKDPLSNSKELFDYLTHNLRDKNIECFEVIFLDAKNKVIRTETLFKGSLTSSSVYPREVAKAALDYHAAALIFAHNHPSGDPAPSPEDIAVTRQLIFACKVMGVIVHEHIIIGDNKYFSFADHGYIEKINREFDAQIKEL
ncbi:JAB domain-containing protein [Desulfobacterium sp. N47]|uniref:DNA repair protein radC homolog n=1 Tax=uncultured Desulfobacterium sp. TaxID=201089 RepID=E1YB58_9BACT|nr:DNA repair protein radC homolog [uncultured Desulfobacterium sp.]